MAKSPTEALALLERGAVEVAVVDLETARPGGLELVRLLLDTSERPLPVIALVGDRNVEQAVEAMRCGVLDCLPKPVDATRFRERLAEAFRLRDLATTLPAEPASPLFEGMAGTSRPMREIFALIERVAPTDANVLLQGESGTGKELVARALHARSRRRTGRFLAVNCAAIPTDLLENEFFGHERGAYTGALDRQPGAFELAQGGTLFLDEIDEMPVALQAKLLRALEEKRFRRLGGREEIEVDVRIVAATDKVLEDLIRAGRFKEELFFRLNVVRLRLPPLRERREDIAMLVRMFIEEFDATTGRHVRDLSPQAWNLVLSYPWPGNVRDLRNAIERAIISATGVFVFPRDLPPRLRRSPATAPLVSLPIGVTAAEAERRLILATLDHCRGNRSRAAALLAIGRRTLQKKLRALGRVDSAHLQSDRQVAT